MYLSLDKRAILACIAYCDLNLIATTPETSDHISIKALKKETIPAALATFLHSEQKGHADATPFALQDYIELVDITGRAIRDDKHGHIDNNFPLILQHLKIDTHLKTATNKSDPALQTSLAREKCRITALPVSVRLQLPSAV